MKKIFLILLAIFFITFPTRVDAFDRDEVFEWANQLIDGEWIRDDDGELSIYADETGNQGVLGRARYEIQSVTFDEDQTIIMTRFLGSDVPCRLIFHGDEIDSMTFENLNVGSLMYYTRRS